MIRLAYLGPAGTYTEEAALRYAPGARLSPYASEGAVVNAVSSGDADEGVLAIENSLEGTVTRTVDALIHDSELSIAAEVVLPIEHCLIVRPGITAAQVTSIHAHPQALAQCHRYIQQHFPNVHQDAALSNAAAVEEIATQQGAAAIAGERAAALYGAVVLDRAIGDSVHNKTRFVVVRERDAPATGRDKTSIAFTVPHDRPGTLVDVLHEFAGRAISLTKIESRPSREELGVYIFLVDFEGHRSDAPVATALAAVQAKAFFFRNLGSYPRWEDA